ncbi:hypothetical protein Tter_0102 [Thermobaculum terrenum ATCC BAA-798]|uniref:histidine kinase n=2 Tax=Thermobaculum TaxID=262406 RepID=D1CDL8_THET1|nr:hypothetical protein Tter_0102 [Thermobaculum terrenum ATCC BAA-798]
MEMIPREKYYHEVRTQLTRAILAAQLLKRGGLQNLDARQVRLLHTLEDSLMRASWLIMTHKINNIGSHRPASSKYRHN